MVLPSIGWFQAASTNFPATIRAIYDYSVAIQAVAGGMHSLTQSCIVER